jgi:hypothetical protein
LWQGLTNYILNGARMHRFKVCFFTLKDAGLLKKTEG